MSLHTKYRPEAFEDVVGHDKVVQSLVNAVEKDASHAYLFHGPSGVGKTTLARIVGAEVEAEVREIDAATNSGVDDMRSLISGLKYKSLGKHKKTLYVIDECHMLSKGAWNALLKSLEEPPAHVYFALCTTEITKVPKTIRTRCYDYALNDVSTSAIEKLLTSIAESEDLDVGEDQIEKIARASNGSPRRAITELAKAEGLDDPTEIAADFSETKEFVEFCRKLAKADRNWAGYMKLLREIPRQDAEGFRRQLFAYFTAIAIKSNKPAFAVHVLDCFRDPYPTGAGIGYVISDLASVFEED